MSEKIKTRITTLGGGRDIGKSCFLLTFLDPEFEDSGYPTVMLDCGAHLKHTDKVPDFDHAFHEGNDMNLVGILITHFHLDHIAALPYFTEIFYKDDMSNGNPVDVILTQPTLKLAPILLKHVTSCFNNNSLAASYDSFIEANSCCEEEEDKPASFFDVGSKNSLLYSQVHVDSCFNKNVKFCFKTIEKKQTRLLLSKQQLAITCIYAGHVLGACMFLVEYKGASNILYTGDYSHKNDDSASYILGGRDPIPRCKSVDLIITESTYATTLRRGVTKQGVMSESNVQFCLWVQRDIARGGIVIIPSSTIGRSQELSLLLEAFFFAKEKKILLLELKGIPGVFDNTSFEVSKYYQEYSHSWLRNNNGQRKMFVNYKLYDIFHTHRKKISLKKVPRPCVLFIPQGFFNMVLTSNSENEYFVLLKSFLIGVLGSELNLIITPGYALPGSVINMLIGEKHEYFKRKKKRYRDDGVDDQFQIQISLNKQQVQVRSKIEYISYNAHTDMNGILSLVTECKSARLKHVTLVHGQYERMKKLGQKMSDEKIEHVHIPENNSTFEI